ASREGDHVRLLPAPAVERKRPLARAAEVEDLLAGEDHGAIGEARDHRREVFGRHGDHRLVEERNALAHMSMEHGRLSLQENTECEAVAISVAPRDSSRVGAGRPRSREVAGGAEPVPVRDEEEASFDAVRLTLVEESLRPAEPAFGRSE